MNKHAHPDALAARLGNMVLMGTALHTNSCINKPAPINGTAHTRC